MSEIINIGTIANDGTGDTLRGAGEKINANFVLPHFGIYDYADLATQTTPIELNAGNSYQALLANDGAGATTNLTYKLPTIDNLFDVATNEFDFSGLALGDEVLIRIDLEVATTVANQIIDVFFEIAKGDINSFTLNATSQVQYKTATIHRIICTSSIYMGYNFIRNNPADITIKSDDDATVKVNGFYIKASKRTV